MGLKPVMVSLLLALMTIFLLPVHFVEAARPIAALRIRATARAPASPIIHQQEPYAPMMGTNARELVLQRYTWHHVADQTVNAYLEYANVQ